MWLFHEGNKNTAELTYDQSDVNPEDRIRMDDIAENYYFASDLDAKDFYTIYFFAQPDAANNITGTPDDKINGLNNPENGYWVDPSNTSNKSQYGYKKFENVYRQLSPEQYDTLGELKCDFQDRHNAIGHFCGFTADETEATNNLQKSSSWLGSNNNISLPKSDKLFNLNKPLSEYDSEDGTIDNTIYLYAVYTNGVDYKNTKNNSIMFKIPEYDEYPMFFLPHKNKYETAYNSEDLDVYFTLPNIRVLQDTETKSLYQNVIYKKESGFASALSFRHLDNNGDRSNNWYLVGTDAPTLADFINNNIQANCYYNFYIYYNQRKGTNTSVLNPSSNTELAKIEKQITSSKHIINTKEETRTRTIKIGAFSSISHDISYYYKFYIERIYNFKLTGGITGSFDFNKSTGNVLFNKTSSSTDTYDVFETKELSFASSYGSDDDARINRTFTFNYGSNYGDIVSADETAVYDSTKNPSLGIKNPAGGDVFYGTEDYSGDNPLYVGNFNKIAVTNYADQNGSFPENDGAQKLPVITIAHRGVYKIRARVYYTAGVPSNIKISVAYLRGLFIEIFNEDIDPSDKNNLISGTEFINHSKPPYKAFFNYQSNPLQPDEMLFTDTSNHTYSLLTLLDKYNESKTEAEKYNGFYDHVGGKNICFDARRDSKTLKNAEGKPLKGQFTLDGGETWIDEFPVSKNFIFYPVTLPKQTEQQTV